MRHFLLLVLLVFATPLALQAEEGEGARLRALASTDEAVQAAALEAWKALPKRERVELLRNALRSKDVEVATIAASALDVRMLDHGEIKRVCRLLLSEPFTLIESDQRASWGFESRHAVGRDELLPFLAAVAARPPEDWHNSKVQSIHKVLRSRHAVGLLPLLESAPLSLFQGVLWCFLQSALYDREDVHRGVVARGLVYALGRLRAQRAGEPIPKLKAVPLDVVSTTAEGLPEAFKELAEASREGSVAGFSVAGDPLPELKLYDISTWLRRWARTLTPGPRDLPFLHALLAPYRPSEESPRVFEGGPTPDLIQWAMRGLARFPGPKGRDQVAAWARESNDRAVHAAAALDSPAGRARVRALFDAGITADELSWIADRPRARREAAREILSAWPPRFPAESARLGPEGRPWIERDYGVKIGDDDLDVVEAMLWAQEASTLTLCSWHAYVRQGLVSDAQVDALVSRLGALPALAEESLDFDKLTPFLATLHHRRPEPVRAVLKRWVETQPTIRGAVLVLLARLGDTAFIDEMLEHWSVSYEGDARYLGRVADERVRAFLVDQMAMGDYPERMAAMQALLVAQGLPPALSGVFSIDADELIDEEPLSGAAVLLREGKGLAAVLHVVAATEGEQDEPDLPDGCLHALGLVDDQRAREALRNLQRARHRGRYWDATVGLALSGDETARAEVVALLEADRTWVLMDFDSSMFIDFEPSLTGLWVERLDSNCCLSFEAMVKLRAMFPTIPWEDGFGGAGKPITRAWLDGRTWTKTPLLDGLVPTGR